MRRLVPWALVGFLLAGAAGGAGLGLAMQPVTPMSGRALLQRIFAATEAAGSARVIFSSVTRSTNRYLRSTTSGSGKIDFHTNFSDLEEVDHSVSLSSSDGGPYHSMNQSTLTETVSVGKVQYERLPTGPPGTSYWVKEPARVGPGINGIAPLLEHATEYGLIPGSPNLGVETIGPAVVGGVETTEYAFTAVPGCLVPARPGQPHVTSGPLDLWVDRGGRLIEAKATFTETVPLGSLPGPAEVHFSGVSTTTSFLRLSDFGAPVRVIVPHVNQVLGESISIGLIAGSSRSCPAG